MGVTGSFVFRRLKPARATFPLCADGRGPTLIVTPDGVCGGRPRSQPHPRYPRPVDSQGPDLGPATWLCGGRMDRARYRRSALGWGGHALPGAPPSRTRGPGRGRVAPLGEQPPRQVLPPERDGPAAASHRHGLLAKLRRGCGARAQLVLSPLRGRESFVKEPTGTRGNDRWGTRGSARRRALV